MHMADALLSPAVGGTMLAVSAGVLACSLRDLRKNFQESRIPLMGVAGAFVFAAQMVNFASPGTGSSGHIGGAVLLAAHGTHDQFARPRIRLGPRAQEAAADRVGNAQREHLNVAPPHARAAAEETPHSRTRH